MNRERLKTLRDHLAGLPDAQFDMNNWCGSACCIGGWAEKLWPLGGYTAETTLDLTEAQARELFYPTHDDLPDIARPDGVAAIDSMLANPDDLALPVWPEKAVSA